MKFRILFIGVFVLCIDYGLQSHLSRNSTLTRDEFIARRNRILAQRQGRNNDQSNTVSLRDQRRNNDQRGAVSQRGQFPSTSRNGQVQNSSTNFNSRNASPMAFSRRRSNQNDNNVNTRVTANINTNRGQRRPGVGPRAGLPSGSVRQIARTNDNRLRGRLNNRQRTRQMVRTGRQNPSSVGGGGGVRNPDTVNDIRGVNPNSLAARLGPQGAAGMGSTAVGTGNSEGGVPGSNGAGSGFDSSISRVILTPVQDGAVRSLRTLLNSGRGTATPRLIGFLIPRPDGRTQLRLMRGAQRFFLSRRRRSQESSDDGNQETPGPMPINLRTILDAARRANLLPSRSGTRGRMNRNPPIVVLRSPNNNNEGTPSPSDDAGSVIARRRGQRRGFAAGQRGGGRGREDVNVDQRRVNIEVNVNNQGDNTAGSGQPRRQRPRFRQRQRVAQGSQRNDLSRNGFGSVTQSPIFGNSIANSGDLFQQDAASNFPPGRASSQNVGMELPIPSLPRRDFQNTFGNPDFATDTSNSVAIGATGRDPPNPFGGRNEPIGRRGGQFSDNRRPASVEIPQFSGSFSPRFDPENRGNNVNSLNNFQLGSSVQQTNNLLPTFSASVDSFQTGTSQTNMVDNQVFQSPRSRVRDRRPQTRVFQPQAAVNDGTRVRDFNTLPPQSEQPMVPVNSFNQIQRQPQILNSSILPAIVPTQPPLTPTNFAGRSSFQDSMIQQGNVFQPQSSLQGAGSRIGAGVVPQFVQPVLPSSSFSQFGGINNQNSQVLNIQPSNTIQPQPFVQTTGIAMDLPAQPPPFVQPVTEQTGAPTIINSQTSSVIEVPNIPSTATSGGGIAAADANVFAARSQGISGQILGNLAEVPVSNITLEQSVFPRELNISVLNTNQSIILNSSKQIQLNPIPTQPTFGSSISPDLKIQADVLQAIQIDGNNTNANTLTPIPIIVQETTGSGVPVQIQTLPGSVNIITESNSSGGQGLNPPLDANLGGQISVAPALVNDPSPVVIEAAPKVQIVTDQAILPPPPPVETTVMVPALQTPDQLALVPTQSDRSTLGTAAAIGKIGVNETAVLTSSLADAQTNLNAIPTGPPPPIPLVTVESAPSNNVNQEPILNTNINIRQPLEQHQFTQHSNLIPPDPLLPLDGQVPSINHNGPQVGLDAGIFQSGRPSVQLPAQNLGSIPSLSRGQRRLVQFPANFNDIKQCLSKEAYDFSEDSSEQTEELQSCRCICARGSGMNAMNILKRMMKNLRTPGMNKPRVPIRPPVGVTPPPSLDMQQLKELIMDVLRTFFTNRRIDLSGGGGQGSAIDLVEKVVVDAASSHIGVVGPQKAIVEQTIKNTVRNTLRNLSSSMTSGGSVPSTSSLPVSPVQGPNQRIGDRTGAAFKNTNSMINNRQNMISSNIHGNVQQNVNPTVSARRSNTSTADRTAKGVVVFPMETVNQSGIVKKSSVSVTLPEITTSNLSSSIETFVNKSQGIMNAVPPTPIAPSIASSPALSISSVISSTIPSISVTPVSTVVATATTPITTNVVTGITDSTITVVTTPPPITSTVLAPVSVLADVTANVTSAPNVTAQRTDLAVSSTLVSIKNTTNLINIKPSLITTSKSPLTKATTNIEIPAPPPALRNPWLSRFPRHLNFSLVYRMPKNINNPISHNVMNQVVRVRQLPNTSSVNVPAISLPSAVGNAIKTPALPMKPPYAIRNLKAHAQTFGLVGHGGDLVRSADVGNPGGLPVFLPGSAK